MKESLQSPWVVKQISDTPVGDSFDFATERVFVILPGVSQEGYTMLEKMVAALKYQKDQVQLVEASVEKIDGLAEDSVSRKVLFFGADLPGRFGQALHWAGHQIIQTHGIESLQNNPALKKETWEHLKLFARLQ